MLCCDRPGCRYLAKTPAELARHRNLLHFDPAPAAALPSQASGSVPSMVSVAGLAPELRQRKRRAPAEAAVEAEGEPVVDDDERAAVRRCTPAAIEMEGPPDVDLPAPVAPEEAAGATFLPAAPAEAHMVGSSGASSRGEVAPPVATVAMPGVRCPRGQYTLFGYKTFLPPKARIVHDNVVTHRFVVTLDQTKLSADPVAVADLPLAHAQKAKPFPFGHGAGKDGEMAQFKLAPDWVWEKHVLLFGGARPDWSHPDSAGDAAAPAPAPAPVASNAVG